jgi:hypothetical protein
VGLSSLFQIHMYRLTARLVLVLTLVAAFAPIVAVASARPHACCIRKTKQCHDKGMAGMSHHAMLEQDDSAASLESSGCAQHSCCRALTVGQSAAPVVMRSAIVRADIGRISTPSHPDFFSLGSHSLRSVRAPPRV